MSYRISLPGGPHVSVPGARLSYALERYGIDLCGLEGRSAGETDAYLAHPYWPVSRSSRVGVLFRELRALSRKRPGGTWRVERVGSETG